MSLHTDIADGVVTALNGGSFSLDFTAERVYHQAEDLGGRTDLLVVVMPRNWSMTGLSRAGAAEEDFVVNVAVRKRVDDIEAATLDPLMTLADEIGQALHGVALDGVDPQAVCVDTERDQVFEDDHLDELRIFTAVLAFTYRVIR